MEPKKRFVVLIVAAVVLLFFTLPAMGAEDKVNINTATLEELATLKGVGTKYAERIIEYRTNVGEFKEPQDIMKVKGVGPKTFEDNKAVIVVKDDE
ncbi:MAG: helix-hairpin-helix domain-containing protein [Desulfobacterium sp.]|jgi:competence protein ComEA|nr:helix-hairpin-helix domain-containing protein [Desulfobacterium sp.]